MRSFAAAFLLVRWALGTRISAADNLAHAATRLEAALQRVHDTRATARLAPTEKSCCALDALFDEHAVVAKHAPPGCVVVTYDDLPAGFDLGRLRPLGEPLVLPNSWTPKQRYYVFEVVADGEARADVAAEGFEHPLALTDDAPLRALADSHQGRRHPDALTADGALPEADQRPFLDQLAATLGTDAVAGFLAPAPTAAPAAAPSAPAPPLPPSADA